jgi:lipid II:glycine glycyltransferase (peptidoglycan interpeptide bridge formation enzyme)
MVLTSENNYIAEIDNVCKDEWSNILGMFADSNIYQTWSYGAVRWGDQNLSHVVLKKNGEVVAAAQLRLLKFPFIRNGIAYIRWGPMWQIREREIDFLHIREMLKALVNEYVHQRGLLLRIIPYIFSGAPEADKVYSIIESEGLKIKNNSSIYRTFLLDIEPPLDEIRKRFRKNWRKHLKDSEEHGLTVLDGHDEKLLEVFYGIYQEMNKLKKFATFVDVNEFIRIQKDLPERFKMMILICKYEGEPVSGVVFSGIGTVGLCLLAATTSKGRNLGSAYLMKWKTIEWMKERGYRVIDLGGIDPKRNPEVDHFKAGMSGLDVINLGEIEICHNRLSSLLVYSGDWIKGVNYKLKLLLEKYTKLSIAK